jgi:hypothetical protein
LISNESRDYELSNPIIKTDSEPLNLAIQHLVVSNPFDSTYPISNSIVYNNMLITLFEPGKFVCLDLIDFKRNAEFEDKINTKKFDYHWLYQNKIIILSDGDYFELDESLNWTQINGGFPIIERPILFEDEEFLVFRDCYGEFGGTLYFYDKINNKYFFTEATCAVTVSKSEKGYEVLITSFNTTLKSKLIVNPRELSETNKEEAHQKPKFLALGYTDNSKNTVSNLTSSELLGFSTFNYLGQPFYIIRTGGYRTAKTFLASFDGHFFKMVHPLFYDGLFTHHPVTTKYINATVINLDFYGIAREREISCLVLFNNKLTKIDWNENHCR